uniref:sulfite oxidase n=1 Tax=Elaeophora elaphi TaxID=1147741 RepID=A0A0R3RK36_9BILA
MLLRHATVHRRLTFGYIVANVHCAKIATKQHHQANDPSKIPLTPSENSESNAPKRWILLGYFGALALAGGAALLKHTTGIGHADTKDNMKIEMRNNLPFYRMEEVKKHGKDAESIWVTFQRGVYDITNFIQSHPGGDKILLAAGGPIDPYWNIYRQHLTDATLEILEELRIGNLDERDIMVIEPYHSDENDPYRNDPKRHPSLIVRSEKPFNAETPRELIMDNFYTTNDLFYVRNHMPVPAIDAKKHKLVIEGISIQQPFTLSLNDLKRDFTRVSVNATLQCAGNRRDEMNAIKKVQGLSWKNTAIGNAKWSGVRLKDVLMKAGVNPNDKRIKHVIIRGADMDSEGNHYETSITFEKAMRDEVIIAYGMNDEDLPRDHGYPMRLIAPGIVGARQVKFLSTIILSEEESKSHWQKRDYKALPPFIGSADHQDFELVPSIQEYPVQSAFCFPATPTKISRSNGQFDVMGYAWSGGGRGIIRVEVSIDGGETWQAAQLDHMWSWTFFKSTIKIPDGVKKLDLVCKATDRSYNTQPDTSRGIWNIRGLLNNAWHRVPIEITND